MTPGYKPEDTVRPDRQRAVAEEPGVNVVGASVAKLDSREKVVGRSEYIADMYRPNMVHAAFVGSPHAHARILGYDVSKALGAPGVVAVLTGDDVADGRMGAFIKDEHALAKGKVLYHGEPVAAVAAETEAQARDAARLIEVHYEELPAVLSPEQGLEPDAPILHENLQEYVKVFDAGSEGNLAARTVFSEGDADSAWDDCDVIVEGEFTTQPQAHVSMEPCGALAEVDATGRVTLWSANQSVFRVQANVCESLQLPMSKLRSLTPRVGAGFGNKMEPHIQPITVALALKCGRPVKMILSREEDFEVVRARHPFRIRMKTGARSDGTLVARECEVLLDCGAFADDSPGVLGYSLLMARGPYRIEHVKCSGKLVYTNKMRFGAFRGFGNPQVTFAGEQQIDQIAGKLGRDPFDLRRQNICREGDPWFLGQVVESNGLDACLDAVESACDWKNRDSWPDDTSRGLGIAITAHISGLLGTGAIVRVLEDGTVSLNTGATDIGQGSDTVLSQICAETLQIPIEQVVVSSPDTDGSPYNWGTTASRVTYTTGRAVSAASHKVVAQMMQYASEMLDCDKSDLELRFGGRIGIKGSNTDLTFGDISGRAHWAEGGPVVGSDTLVFDRNTHDPKRASALGLPFPRIGVMSFGALATEVEVDHVTGKTSVCRAWTAADVGRAINPQLVEVQLEGGFVQGMGFALCEEMVWDGPRLANPSLMDYKVPTSRDIPDHIESIIVEAPEPDGPFGAKGAGEICINPVAASIANAVYDATGFRHHHLPLTPERVLNGLLDRDQTGPVP
ncbi:xanthine dehydrogenase family protein molybdopterin-binding subunit [Ruegeria lacuscaerulensis]|uniref:xanthine dehydrogenase family protein molybdopterin-binding subunit n=1 Tax=Ruegeria lacuscaerulensis TaxID=55218 RepID=UPI00147FF9DE|nr:xanthine dehydrogenase family protein molybdopterin-binding subunit [Ruegeria lacuscaerulensis]